MHIIDQSPFMQEEPSSNFHGCVLVLRQQAQQEKARGCVCALEVQEDRFFEDVLDCAGAALQAAIHDVHCGISQYLPVQCVLHREHPPLVCTLSPPHKWAMHLLYLS